MGHASNNKVELSSLWDTLRVAQNSQIQEIQIFGDLKVVIDWANEQNNIRAPHLQHLLTEIQSLKSSFRRISFGHFYRELNMEADSLSKQALAYHPGLIEIEEVEEGILAFHYETLCVSFSSYKLAL